MQLCIMRMMLAAPIQSHPVMALLYDLQLHLVIPSPLNQKTSERDNFVVGKLEALAKSHQQQIHEHHIQHPQFPARQVFCVV